MLRVALRVRSVIVAADTFCVYFDLRLRFELRNSPPQSVLRFCVFGGQGIFGLTKKTKTVLSGWTVCGKEYLLHWGHAGDLWKSGGPI